MHRGYGHREALASDGDRLIPEINSEQIFQICSFFCGVLHFPVAKWNGIPYNDACARFAHGEFETFLT